jgi:hypothetical protein
MQYRSGTTLLLNNTTRLLSVFAQRVLFAAYPRPPNLPERFSENCFMLLSGAHDFRSRCLVAIIDPGAFGAAPRESQ